MIVVVNYGIGNLDSVVRAFRKCGAEVTVSSDPPTVSGASGIVLPGVGSFDEAINNLKTSGMIPILNHAVLEARKPVLGICLGFQLFTRSSEEGHEQGFGWIDGETTRIRSNPAEGAVKIPHMGWNDLEVRKTSPLLDGVPPDACFYFAHSFCVVCHEKDAVLATSSYGQEFVAAVAKDNLFGVQFHPEKSHASGLQLVRNFIERICHA